MEFLITPLLERSEQMSKPQLLDPVRILHGSKSKVVHDAALITRGELVALGNDARQQAQQLGIQPKNAAHQLLAPCLIDPHSVLQEPISGRSENLLSFCRAAAAAGYGQVALLPRSPCSRDHPDRLQGLRAKTSDVEIHLWANFSKSGEGTALSCHADLLENGALGLADDDLMIPLALIQRGLVLGEMGQAPVLFAPRDIGLQADGMVRESVEALRSGWPTDPIASETFPLRELIELHHHHPQRSLRLMNLSTAAGVKMLAECSPRPMASVSWWHLVADSSLLSPTELGWRVSPSLGNSRDRNALIQSLADGILNAVAVHAIPLDEEDVQKPPDQRVPGLTGHQLVLPALWKELVVKRNWSVEDLWEVLSFGPSRFLNLPEEKLSTGSNRWLLFDPAESWVQDRHEASAPLAANQPWQGRNMQGRVISTGLKIQEIPCD